MTSAHSLIDNAVHALQRHDFSSAKRLMQTYSESEKHSLRTLLIEGLAEIGLEDWPSVLATFSTATKFYPDDVHCWFNLALAQEKLGDDVDAEKSLRQVIKLQPKMAEAHGNLSNVCLRLGRAVDAEAEAYLALKNGANKVNAYNSLGLALARQGRFAEAEKSFDSAISEDQLSSQAWLNRANCAVDQGCFEKAWPDFGRARQLSALPAYEHEEALSRLLAAQFDIGWQLFEARLRLPKALTIPAGCPRIESGDVAGKKILILSEQGLGDTIHFCRFGKLLAQRGAKLIWVVQPSLVRFLTGQLPGSVIARGQKLPDADCFLPLMSLPLATGALQPTAWPSAPYLTVPATGPSLPRDQGPVVGLVWQGSPTHKRDHERSVPLEMLSPLWKEFGHVQFCTPSLTTADAGVNTPVVSLAPLIRDFADTAFLVKQLDCLVTVDTSVAHLAGAIGVPTFLLLPFAPDWRWGSSGSRTPWYPSLMILRQKQVGDWAPVVTEAIELMRPLLGSR